MCLCVVSLCSVEFEVFLEWYRIIFVCSVGVVCLCPACTPLQFLLLHFV